MDSDLDGKSREQLIDEVRRLRAGIRKHRDSSGHDLCWHHPELWGLLPERSDPLPVVPEWPQFMAGCIHYRASLDAQAPDAPRTTAPYTADAGTDHPFNRKRGSTSMKFQRMSVVRLCSPELVPPDSADDERIQAEHIAYLADLRHKGIIALNGPVRFKDSPNFRGMTIYTVDVEEARTYALADPAVKAGWFEVVADGWWLPSIPITVGDRVDIEI